MFVKYGHTKRHSLFYIPLCYMQYYKQAEKKNVYIRLT